MTTREILIYTAGLFDGEGSIVIGASKRKRSTGVKLDHWLQVGIGMTDKPIIEWLHMTFGGHMAKNGKKREQGARRQSWAWRVMSNQGAEFLSRVRPFLRSKGAQADLAISFQHHIRNRESHFVDDSELAIREQFRATLRSMTNGKMSATAWR